MWKVKKEIPSGNGIGGLDMRQFQNGSMNKLILSMMKLVYLKMMRTSRFPATDQAISRWRLPLSAAAIACPSAKLMLTETPIRTMAIRAPHM